MSTKTTNYNLTKPAATDNYDIAIPNANMDIIDTQLKVNADAAAGGVPKSLATASDQVLVSTAAGSWAVKTLLQIKSWLGLGGAAYLNTGTASGTVATGDHGHTSSKISDFAATVLATVLTVISTATDAAITASDTVLAAFGKLQAQVTAHRTNTNNPHGTTIVQLGGGNATCATAAATAAKVATLTGYALAVGTPLVVEFTNQNTASNVTVACNSQAAKAVVVGGVAAKWWQIPLKAVLEYNGTSYNLLNPNTSFKKTATLAVANWTGSSAPYTYTLADADILAADTPHVDRVTGTDAAAAALINTAWGLIAGYAVKPQTSADAITFYASSIPAVAIPIMYEVVRT